LVLPLKERLSFAKDVLFLGHLLQAALRNILGTHIKQAGSLVAPERLRFDFTHFAHIDPEILEKIELWINRSIRKNLPVETQEMPLIQAIKSGAIAIFEEKYADMVRVVSIAGFGLRATSKSGHK